MLLPSQKKISVKFIRAWKCNGGFRHKPIGVRGLTGCICRALIHRTAHLTSIGNPAKASVQLSPCRRRFWTMLVYCDEVGVFPCWLLCLNFLDKKTSNSSLGCQSALCSAQIGSEKIFFQFDLRNKFQSFITLSFRLIDFSHNQLISIAD